MAVSLLKIDDECSLVSFRASADEDAGPALLLAPRAAVARVMYGAAKENAAGAAGVTIETQIDRAWDTNWISSGTGLSGSFDLADGTQRGEGYVELGAIWMRARIDALATASGHIDVWIRVAPGEIRTMVE